MTHFENEGKSSGIAIIATRNEEADYPFIPICRLHGYKKHNKTRLLLSPNQGSILFAERYSTNVIVTYNFWNEDTLIVGDPDRSRHFRLDAIHWEQLLVLNDV